MQTDVSSDNSRGVKYALEILYKDENAGDDHRMRPVARLESCNENGWHPADDYADVWDHGQNDDKRPNHRRKIETKNRQCRADENAIHQTHQQLSSKICGDVSIDLRQQLRDFISEG